MGSRVLSSDPSSRLISLHCTVPPARAPRQRALVDTIAPRKRGANTAKTAERVGDGIIVFSSMVCSGSPWLIWLAERLASALRFSSAADSTISSRTFVLYTRICDIAGKPARLQRLCCGTSKTTGWLDLCLRSVRDWCSTVTTRPRAWPPWRLSTTTMPPKPRKQRKAAAPVPAPAPAKPPLYYLCGLITWLVVFQLLPATSGVK